MAVILGQSLFIPILLAPIAYLIGRRAGSKAGWFAFAVLAYSTAALLFAAIQGSDYVETYPWQPIGEFGLKLDGLSLPFAAIIYILSTTLAVYSIPYMERKIKEDLHNHAGENKQVINSKTGLYYSLYMLYAAGMLGTVLATNLIQFYIFFELMLLPSFFLLAEFGYGDRYRISLMYFLWTHVGAAVLLGAILAIGFLTGSFEFARIATSALPEGIRTWVAIAVSIGLFIKLAAAGVHVWLPYAHAEAPTPISALLSPAMIGIGGYAFIRILIFLVPSAYSTIAFWISIWGLITMVYGGLMAFAQDDLKRVFAYSSVSQMGYIIFGMASAYYIGVGGSVFQYVSHGTGKALLFMSAGAIIMQTGGLRNISKLGGLASKLPITATCALIGFLVIIGVPPMNGFQSEWMLFFGSFAGALQSGAQDRLIITGLALATTPLTAGYTLWTMKRVFFGKLPPNLANVKDPSAAITIPLLFLAALSMVLGIYPDLIVQRLMPLLSGVMQ
ncbi:MAG: NADH-quinone oxidoreductase subunit M [Thaumarchaeota archaeon]|nr:NADH-quinone oxidoreductase subunit M [Nitrososphaerota archaeon]